MNWPIVIRITVIKPDGRGLLETTCSIMLSTWENSSIRLENASGGWSLSSAPEARIITRLGCACATVERALLLAGRTFVKGFRQAAGVFAGSPSPRKKEPMATPRWGCRQDSIAVGPTCDRGVSIPTITTIPNGAGAGLPFARNGITHTQPSALGRFQRAILQTLHSTAIQTTTAIMSRRIVDGRRIWNSVAISGGVSLLRREWAA